MSIGPGLWMMFKRWKTPERCPQSAEIYREVVFAINEAPREGELISVQTYFLPA
jgi:hypothetical protein